MSLRASQFDTLEAVRDLAAATPRKPAYGADLWSIADRLGRDADSAERSLIRLAELGYLQRSSAPTSKYSLTDKGRAAIRPTSLGDER